MLTKFQFNYLNEIISSYQINEIIFAVTSADHSNTRRNPLPLYLRTMALENFASNLKIPTKIYPIPDIPSSLKFADYILKQIYYQSQEKLKLTPKNCLVLCSTPSVIAMFEKLDFKILPAELVSRKPEKYKALRPYEVTDLLVKSDKSWRKYASSATQNLYDQYNLRELIIELFKDSLISDEGDITETRNYTPYALEMDKIVRLKYDDIKPFVISGKIVDAGCGTGALIKLISQDFREADIIGIEATREFYEYAKRQKYDHEFVFFYRRNILNQNFKPNSIDSFIYSSILHEVYSYWGVEALRRLLKNTFRQLRFKGRIIIRDVVGPENKNKKILAKFCPTDEAKFLKFAKEYKYPIKYKVVYKNHKKLYQLSLKDAYEFISKKDYLDNWQSELKEEFGFWDFKEWIKELKKAGFKMVDGSKTFTNSWIVENRYKNKVWLSCDWPPTNMILVGEK